MAKESKPSAVAKFCHIARNPGRGFTGSGWNGYLTQNFVQYRLSVAAGPCARARHHHPVSENRADKTFDVVRQYKVTRLDQRQRLCGAKQRDRAALTGAEFDVGMIPAAIDELQHVIDDRFIDVNLTARFL